MKSIKVPPWCKKFTVDFLQKKIKVNESDVPQYYVENSLEAIVLPEEWEKVQMESSRRKSSGHRTRCNSPFSGKLVCDDYGEIFDSKVWHSAGKYRRMFWQRNAKLKARKSTIHPHLYERI